MFKKEINLFKQILKGKCSRCGEGDMFKKNGNIFFLRAAKMNEDCPNCEHHYEQEPGYFLGAMYISYAMSVAEAFAVYLIIFSFVDDITYIIGIILSTVLLLSMWNYRYSRIVWTYIVP